MTNTSSSPGTSALLPCPFCGGEGVLHSVPSGMAWVSCEECLISAPSDLGEMLATKRWNRRAGVAQAQREPHETTYLRGWNEGTERALEIVGNMRQSEAGLFDDAKHSGQRGCDRADALYDAYVAIRASLVPSTDKAPIDPCPKCGSSMDGGPIPENIRKHYSPPYRWSRKIGISDRDEDALVAWECPDCKGRWPVSSKMHSGEK